MTPNNFHSLVLVLALFFFHVGYGHGHGHGHGKGKFIKTKGTHFELKGKKLYFNGFNSYWMMYMASDPNTRPKVTCAFQEASKNGMNLARIWAFSDGGYRPLQSPPGTYHDDMFKGLDFVISEARKYGVYLILSLVNNWDAYGGKKQYVQWGKEKGRNLTNVDDFFTDPLMKQYYKNHIWTILTRNNSLNGMTYKDDPTIMSWELMNEPRCMKDLSGKTLRDWILEMGAHVKSIDKNHLLEVGLEGFYNTPSFACGTNFISNNQVPTIDFATIHLYPELWAPKTDRFVFAEQWIRNHVNDSNLIIKKPILMTEFGMSSRLPGFNVSARDAYYGKLYDMLYNSAKAGESCAGGLIWQLFVRGMDSFGDGDEIILDKDISTAKLMASQSRRIRALH